MNRPQLGLRSGLVGGKVGRDVIRGAESRTPFGDNYYAKLSWPITSKLVLIF